MKFISNRFRLFVLKKIGRNSFSNLMKRKKETHYVSYALNSVKPLSIPLYSFDLLIEIIKNTATGYNLIKIKEVQNKLELYIPNLNIEEVLSLLIVCCKYHFLNSQILSKLSSVLFHHSCFLCSHHLYVLIKLLGEEGALSDFSTVPNVKQRDEEYEELTWRKKFSKEVEEHLLKVPVESVDSGMNEERIEFEKIDEGSVDISKNVKYEEEDYIKEIAKIQTYIRTVLHHNYENILYSSTPTTLYCNLFLLNYLQIEGIITIEEYWNHIYNINNEWMYYNISDINKNEMQEVVTCCSKRIIHDYMKSEIIKNPLIELYIDTHFNVLKRLFDVCTYIEEDHLIEKVECRVPLKKEVYSSWNLLVDLFSLFFKNCMNTDEKNIDHIKLFYMNICFYELIKMNTDSSFTSECVMQYSMLQKVKCTHLLESLYPTTSLLKKNDQYYVTKNMNRYVYLLTIMYYLKQHKQLKYKMNLFGKISVHLKELQEQYKKFVESIFGYTLYDLIWFQDILLDSGTNEIREENKDMMNSFFLFLSF